MVMFLARPAYIFGAVVRVTVGAVYRSCVVRREGAVGIRRGDFRRSVCLSVEVPIVFCGTCLYLTVVFPFNWNFW